MRCSRAGKIQYLTKKYEGKLNTRKTFFVIAWDLGGSVNPGSTYQDYAPRSTLHISRKNEILCSVLLNENTDGLS